MAPQTLSDLVVTGAFSLVVAPRPSAATPASWGLEPERWAGVPARLARMDRLSALALVACDGALLDGQLQPLDEAAFAGERLALVLGTAYGCHATNEEYYRGLLAAGPSGVSPRRFAYTLPSSALGEIGIHYRARGPATTVASGLTAGLDALLTGIRQLRAGRVDRALVLAAEVATPLLAALLGNGLTIRDGAAALLVERRAQATTRGAVVRGRIISAARGYATGDRATAVAGAARRALDEAGLTPDAITLVLATPADAASARSLGVSARADDPAPETLGAAPLVAAARFFAAPEGVALLLAGDPAGAGAAALLSG